MDLIGWLLSGLVVATGGGVLYRINRPSSSTSTPLSFGAATPVPPTTSYRPRPANQLQVLRFAALIGKTGGNGLINEIENKFGFARSSFEADVLPVLSVFAEYVQLLPASESHHHAQPGGLQIHLLEVARNALHLRQGMKLPLGSSPEDQARLGARWTYGIFLAALFHDIGKPISDVQVTLFGADPENGRTWNAIAGDMTETDATHYSIDFPERRDYAQHQKLPIVLLRALVPTSSLQWMGEAPGLLDQLVAYLSGEPVKSPITDLVTKADRISVADNLLHGPRTRFASAKTIPLIERLMLALRRMLEEGAHLPLNRPGAAGFFDGEHVWFVAGTVADKVRAFMKEHETRLPGASGVPDNNSVLMDVWMEYGAVVPNESGSAIWRISVTVGTWRETLTALKFPAALLYPDPARYPQPVAGAVDVIASSSAVAPTALPPAVPSTPTPAPQSPPPSLPAPYAIQDPSDIAADNNQSPPAEEERPSYELSPYECPPVPADIPVEAFSEVMASPYGEEQIMTNTPAPEAPAPEEFLDAADSAQAVLDARRNKPAPKSIKAPMAAAEKNEGLEATQRKASQRAEQFMAWVQQGLADGSQIYNDPAAVVHFVPEGMLLLTPGIIKRYVEQCGLEGDGVGSTEDKDWRRLQHEFQKSGYPLKSGAGSYIHYYTTTKRSDRSIGAYLVPKPERFINPVPSPNPFIFSKQRKDEGGNALTGD